MTNQPITLTITAFGMTSEVTLTPEFEEYANKGRTAISFYEDGMPFARLTVNLPDQHLNEGEVFVKDWSENQGLVEALVEAGYLIPTGREVYVDGFVFPKVMTTAFPPRS